MRKNRFILNLIAATAIGLSAFGCGSGSGASDNGVIRDAADIGANDQNANERRQLHEYMIIGQRSLTEFGVTPGAGQSEPADAVGDLIGGTGDGVIDDGRAQLFEITGIAELPLPNANITGPGGGASPTTPTVSADASNLGTTGYHQVYADPTGRYVIGISRTKNRAGADETGDVQNSQMQIFGLNFTDPLDVTFPPVIEFGAVPDNTPIRNFQVDQGEFVSGTWSADARHFYLSIEGQVTTFTINGNTGGLDAVSTTPFPGGGTGVNNALEMLPTANGAFVYAIDHANSQIVRYARDNGTGVLTQLGVVNVQADPRGATIDRSGNFMYVVSRTGETIEGFRIEATGDLTPIAVFAGGFGAIPTDLGSPLGDVDANPQRDQLFIATYAGVLQGYSIDPATGALSVLGASGRLLAGARNTANIEVEPTGAFVIAVQEADLDGVQSFIDTAFVNLPGSPYNAFAVENPIFANLNSASNGAGGAVYVDAPGIADSLGRIALALPGAAGELYGGGIEVFRIQGDGSVRSESRVNADNPYGLTFFQRVLTPPAAGDQVPF